LECLQLCNTGQKKEGEQPCDVSNEKPAKLSHFTWNITLSNAKDLQMVKKFAEPIAKVIRIGVDIWLDVVDCKQ